MQINISCWPICSALRQENRPSLTNFRHFWDTGKVDLLGELRCVVIDVMNFDVELCVRLQLLICVAIQHLCVERVHCLLLSVQPLGGMNIPGLLVNQEKSACTFSCQNVFHIALTFVHVGVQLNKKQTNREIGLGQVLNGTLPVKVVW